MLIIFVILGLSLAVGAWLLKRVKDISLLKLIGGIFTGNPRAKIALYIIIVGWLFRILKNLPLGHLPGDILIETPYIKINLPIITSITILVISYLVYRLFRKK